MGVSIGIRLSEVPDPLGVSIGIRLSEVPDRLGVIGDYRRLLEVSGSYFKLFHFRLWDTQKFQR